MGKKKLHLNILLGGLVIVGLFFNSCSSDDVNTGSITSGNVVKTDAEAYALVNGVYSPLQTLSSSYSFLVESATEGTISFEGEESEPGPVVSRFETQPTTWYPVKVFNRLYKAIGLTNTAIAEISASDSVSQSAKTITIARAKFLRGYAYTYLVQLFGEVPLVVSVSDSLTGAKRASIDDVYTQIVKDLTEAREGLPDYDSSPIIPSKETADAMLARAYLAWAHNPLTQTQLESLYTNTTDPEETVDNDKLGLALKYANNVISSGNYSLLTDYTKLFGRANESKAPEHIFTIRHDGDAYDAQGNHQTHCGFTYAFDWSKENHISPADQTPYDTWLAEDPGDSVRRNFSYTTKLYDPQGDTICTFYPPRTVPRFGKAIDRSYTNSVYLAITTNDDDRIDLRYAEVLMIKAEALFYLNRVSEALPVVNQIRERAFGNSDHDLKTLTEAALWKEWDHEFVYEQKNWFNLVRAKQLVSTVKTVSTFEHFDDSYSTAGATGRDGSIVSAFFAKVYKHLHAKYNNVKVKFYRFPIPTGESGDDLDITPQNPGY